MPRPAQPPEVRHAIRRERLVERLLLVIDDLLLDAGSFGELRIDEVIAAAGIARSTFYRYFEDKTELLLALSGTAVREVIEAADRLLALPPTATRDGVRELARETVGTFAAHVALLGALSELAASDRRAAAALRRSFGLAQQRAAARIAEAQRLGTARPDIDADAVAGWLTWMVERGMQQLVADAGDDQRLRLEHALADIIWFTVSGR